MLLYKLVDAKRLTVYLVRTLPIVDTLIRAYEFCTYEVPHIPDIKQYLRNLILIVVALRVNNQQDADRAVVSNNLLDSKVRQAVFNELYNDEEILESEHESNEMSVDKEVDVEMMSDYSNDDVDDNPTSGDENLMSDDDENFIITTEEDSDFYTMTEDSSESDFY